jgi:hypothetical protein
MHALDHSQSDSVIDRAIATLNFDNAIEMFLYALLDYLGTQAPEENFNSLLKVFKDKITEKRANLDLSLLHEVEIKNMHRARNGVQHHGIVPSIDDVERYVTLTNEVLANLSKPILGVGFEEISLCRLVKDNLVRNLYEKAEGAYFSSNYEDALVYVAGAFEQAKKMEQGRIYGSGLMLARVLDGDSNKVTDKLIDEIEVLKLRLDYKKYQKYRDVFQRTFEPFTQLSSNTIEGIVNEIRKLVANSLSMWRNMDNEELKEETTYCIGFVLESVLKWETVTRLGWQE